MFRENDPIPEGGTVLAESKRQGMEGAVHMAIKTLKEREREHLQVVLKKTSWDLDKTARLLQIPLSQVKRKIREHGFEMPPSE